MQWWNDFVDWLQSDAGWAVLTGAVFPFLAIIVAGVIGALVGRGATRRLVQQRDHETRASAVAALVTAGRAAATWHSLSPQAKEHSETLAAAADIQVRLLPISGSGLAADWAGHQLDDMRTNSVNYTFQADQTLDEYRDRLALEAEHVLLLLHGRRGLSCAQRVLPAATAGRRHECLDPLLGVAGQRGALGRQASAPT